MAPRKRRRKEKKKEGKPKVWRKARPITTSSKTLPEWVQNALECPVCLKMITDPPVYVCENTHLLCDVCHGVLKQRKDSCPVCRGNLTDKRNWTVEKLLESAFEKTSCKFEECNYKKADKSRVERHEKEDCPHRKIVCFHCEDDNVNQEEEKEVEVTLSKMADHLVKEHFHQQIVDGYKFGEAWYNGVTEVLWDSCWGGCLIFKTTVDQKPMIFFQNFTMINDEYLLIWCAHNGSKSDNTFKYAIKLYSGEQTAENKREVIMSFKGPCLPIDVPLQSIKDDMPCLMVSKQFIYDHLAGPFPTYTMKFTIVFMKSPSTTV